MNLKDREQQLQYCDTDIKDRIVTVVFPLHLNRNNSSWYESKNKKLFLNCNSHLYFI